VTDATTLRLVKLAHTAIWAFMASAIVALPFFGWTRHFGRALFVTALVLGEGVVLMLNHGHCPLTDIAARYTTDRADNFDIYLPLLLARYNKQIFGALFLAGEAVVVARWIP
jgi:hypothetical protein